MIPGNRMPTALQRAASAARVTMLAIGLSATGLAQAAHCTDTPVSGKTYYIVNADSGLQLDVAYGRTTAGGDVIQWGAGTQANQRWTMTQQSDGSWKLVATHSGLVLDVRDANATVTQQAWEGSKNQRWYVQNKGDAFTLASSLSWKVLSAADKSAGSKLQQQWLAQDAAQQRWYFDPVDGQCSGSGKWNSFLGYNRILIGGTLDEKDPNNPDTASLPDTYNKAPWDLQYAYIHSAPAPFPACYAQCQLGCNSYPDGGWWGCWKMSSDGKWNTESGQIIRLGNEKAQNKTFNSRPSPMVQHWTWYSAEDIGKMQKILDKDMYEGSIPSYGRALQNPTLLKSYMEDFRFFLQKIGNAKTTIELEPDFWGFVRAAHQVKGQPELSDAHRMPAASVEAASWNGKSSDCAGYENSVAGVARCLVHMVRVYAPQSAVGMHVTCWSGGMNGPHCVNYYKTLGASEGDFLISDVTDRDSGWVYKTQGQASGDHYAWTNEEFLDFLRQVKQFTEAIGKPMMLWQIPLGNATLDNTYGPYDKYGNRPSGRWVDDKVKHFFDNMEKVADAHIVGLMFGAGYTEGTGTESDGGYFLKRALEYYAKGGQPLK